MRSAFTTERLLLFGILFISFAFRIAQFDTSFFGPEQALIASDGLGLARLQTFPMHFQPSSAGYHNFPLTHYLAAIPYIFSENIFALFLFYVVVNLIAVWSGWLFVRRYWGWQVAALATLVYVTMPYAVLFSYRIWNNTLMPPFIMLWAWGCGFAFQERRPRGLMLAWAAAVLALQLHISAIIFVLILLVMMGWIRLPHSKRHSLFGALFGVVLAMIPALPWFYAQLSGLAQLVLDLSPMTGNAGLHIHLRQVTQFLSASDLAWNVTSAGAENLTQRLNYMRYLGPLWLLLFGAGLLYLLWRLRSFRQKIAQHNPLLLLLALWCLLPLGFTVVSSPLYTIVYYLPMLPAPGIVLALAIKWVMDWRLSLKTPVVLGLLVLCTLNLNAVWSLENFIRVGVDRGEPTTHAFSLDKWYYSDPLVWQLDIATEMRELLEDGVANEMIMLQLTYPDEDHLHLRQPFSYHLRGYDVRAVNIFSPHILFPQEPALFLHDVTDFSYNGDYEDLLEFRAFVGPYRLDLLPGGLGPEPSFLLAHRPAYENGLQLMGFDELQCDGHWRLHWTPGPADEDSDPVHIFVHLLAAEGNGLAHSDLRAYDVWDWRTGDHIITEFDFGQELAGLTIQTIRVGLYTYSEKTKTFQEGIYALDEQGRPREYAVDIPYEGNCSP